MKLLIKTFYCLIALALICFFSSGCSSERYSFYNHQNSCCEKVVLSDSVKQAWYLKDIVNDTIPGISAEKAFEELIGNKKPKLKEIIIAVLDTELDINHKAIKECIWINSNEIPNNKIDDDNNGYIDDTNGWNFLGNSKYEMTKFSNFEYTRILKKYGDVFRNRLIGDFSTDSIVFYNKYIKAKKAYNKVYEEEMEYSKYLSNTKKKVNKLKKTLSKYSVNGEFVIDRLDAIRTEDEDLQKSIKKMIQYLKIGGDTWQRKWEQANHNYFEKYLDLNFNNRYITGDNVDDINDNEYGSNRVCDSLTFSHATKVVGLINLAYGNQSEIVRKRVKIMPLVTSCNGDEHDKDIALAIRYAVVNGAKIINMTFSKDFSLYNDWIVDAIDFARENDVLIVSAAGNQGYNLDLKDYYPNDIDNMGKEFTNNFINVSASTWNINKRLVANFSCYGKNNVDLFAPGVEIYTTTPHDKYKFDSGTSLATPIVSGIAAIVWLYYPKLKASEIKEILMDSGVSYDIDVEITNEEGEKVLVPFSSLSKSGKIVNAYNALLMAEKYSNSK